MKCAPLGKKSKLFLFFGFSLTFFFFLGRGFYLSFYPPLPSKHVPILFYSNHCRQNLRFTLIHALKKAKRSIHMVTYGFHDEKILNCLNEKALQLLEMKIFFDKKASPPIQLPNHKAFSIKERGLLHQKIVVVDGKKVFLGSANITTSSLLLHDNLMVGLYSKKAAEFLTQNTPFHGGFFSTKIKNSLLEIYLLPDFHQNSLKAIRNQIQNAKSQVIVACFNLTHPDLIHDLIRTKNRGVKVEIFIDRKARYGASCKAMDRLKTAKIPIYLSQKASLFHHKLAIIDQNCLILGSANWSRAAFLKNQECFLILHSLDQEQKNYFLGLHKILLCECKLE